MKQINKKGLESESVPSKNKRWMPIKVFGENICYVRIIYENDLGVIDLLAQKPQGRLIYPHPHIEKAMVKKNIMTLAGNTTVTLRYHLKYLSIPSSRESFHTEFSLGPNFEKGFFTHDRSFISFVKPEGDRKGFSYNKDSGIRGGDMSLWHKYYFFYSPAFNITACFFPLTSTSILQTKISLGTDKEFYYAVDQEIKRKKNTARAGFNIYCYKPASKRFWWVEGFARAKKDYNIMKDSLPILTAPKRGFSSDENVKVFIINAGDAGKSFTACIKNEFTDEVIKGIAVRLKGNITELLLGKYNKSAIYSISLKGKKTAFVVRNGKPKASILFVAATNQWRAYSRNGYYYGGHSYPFDRSYGAMVLQSPFPGWEGKYGTALPLKHNFLPPLWETSTKGILIALKNYSKKYSKDIDFCAEEDIHFNKIELSKYRLVIMDSHSEYSTVPEIEAFLRYINSGGGMLFLGADNFGRLVSYEPNTYQMEFQKMHFLSGYNMGFPRSKVYDRRLGGKIGVSSTTYKFGSDTYIYVIDDSHPVVKGFKNNEKISSTYWEGDRLTTDWRIVAVARGKDAGGKLRESVGLAFHRKLRLAQIGPMGITHSFVSNVGNKRNLQTILDRTIEYLLSMAHK